jgi:hypothetical protein
MREIALMRYHTDVNAFEWMRLWIGVLIAAIGIIWFLTRTRQH